MLERRFVHREIRQSNAAGEPVRRFRDIRDSTGAQFEGSILLSGAAVRDDSFHGQTACHLAGRMPAHSVGENEEADLLRDREAILITLANAAGVRARTSFYFHSCCCRVPSGDSHY